MRTLFLAQSARLADFLPAIGFVLLLARSMGPTEYGRYALVFNVAFVCMSLLPPSLPDLFGRHLSSGEFDGFSVAGLALRFRLPFAALGACVVAGGLAAGLSDGPMVIAGGVAVFLSLEYVNYTQAAAAGLLAYGSLMRWRAIGRGASLALAIGLESVGALDPTSGLLALAIGQAVTASGTLHAIWTPLARLGGHRQLGTAHVRRFAVETWFAAVLTIGLGTQKDVLLLGFLGASANSIGVYSAAATLSTQLALLLTGGWVPASLPLLTRLRNDDAAFTREWRRLVRGWALVVAPSFAALAIGATQLVPILFGRPYEAAAAPLMVFAVGYALTAFVGGAVNQLALYARDRATEVLVCRSVALAVNLCLAGILIPELGALGAAAATAVAVIVVFILEYSRVRRMGSPRLPLQHLTAIGGAILAAGLVAVTIGAATQQWLVAAFVAIAGFLAIAIRVREIVLPSAREFWRVSAP